MFYTLAIELVLCWMIFLPRRFRIAFFFIVTPFQIGIILTGNYAFLNYIVCGSAFCFSMIASSNGSFQRTFVRWLTSGPKQRAYRR